VVGEAVVGVGGIPCPHLESLKGLKQMLYLDLQERPQRSDFKRSSWGNL
jgi:hypothetical protein